MQASSRAVVGQLHILTAMPFVVYLKSLPGSRGPGWDEDDWRGAQRSRQGFTVAASSRDVEIKQEQANETHKMQVLLRDATGRKSMAAHQPPEAGC